MNGARACCSNSSRITAETNNDNNAIRFAPATAWTATTYRSVDPVNHVDVAELDTLRIVLDPVGQTGVALSLMIVMFSVALGLSIDDFRFLRDRPLLFAGGVATQVLVLPAVTLLLLLAIRPAASIALGMIVVACCPGGAVSNLLTYLSRGNRHSDDQRYQQQRRRLRNEQQRADVERPQ